LKSLIVHGPAGGSCPATFLFALVPRLPAEMEGVHDNFV
jgi:hypothetical protein